MFATIEEETFCNALFSIIFLGKTNEALIKLIDTEALDPLFYKFDFKDNVNPAKFTYMQCYSISSVSVQFF